MELRYRTSADRRNEVINAICHTFENGNSIYIDLLTVTSSSDKDRKHNYQIKHGNYFPKSQSGKETWNQFYIDGYDEGFKNGFQTIEDISLFLDEEIGRLEAKKVDALTSNNHKSEEGIYFEKWDGVSKAWEVFRRKFEKAKKEGKIIDVETAKDAVRKMNN